MRAVLEPVPLQGLASVQSVCFFWKEVIEKASPALTVSLRSTALHTKVPQSLLKLRAISHVCGFRSVLRRAPRGFCAGADSSGHWQRTVQVWPRFLSDHQPQWSQDLKNKHKRPRLNLLSGPHSDCIHGAHHHTYGPPYGCEPWLRRRLHFTSWFLQQTTRGELTCHSHLWKAKKTPQSIFASVVKWAQEGQTQDGLIWRKARHFYYPRDDSSVNSFSK